MSMGETCTYCGVWMRGNRACSATDSKRQELLELSTCGNATSQQQQDAREAYSEQYLGWR